MSRPQGKASAEDAGATEQDGARRRRRIIALIAGVLAVAIAGGIVAFTLLQRPGDREADARTAAPEATTAPSARADDPVGPPTAVEAAPPTSGRAQDIAIDAAGALAPGVTATVVSREPVAGEAEGPGEVAGPALRFTVRLVNDSSAEVDLATIAVNAYSGADRTPANPISGPGGDALDGVLAPGETTQGVYVFTVPVDQRAQVALELDYAAGEVTILFAGDLR